MPAGCAIRAARSQASVALALVASNKIALQRAAVRDRELAPGLRRR